jgi:hypothetical protein
MAGGKIDAFEALKEALNVKDLDYLILGERKGQRGRFTPKRISVPTFIQGIINSGISIANFIDLTDTPTEYDGQGGKFLAVKLTEDGIEFVDSGTLGSYTNPLPTTETVGGIEAGSTFDNVPFNEMWDRLLYPFQEPSFTTFILSGYSTIEVGDEIPAGLQTYTWAATNPGNVETNSIEIVDVTNGNTVLGTGLANDGSEALLTPQIVKLSNTSHSFKITGDNTEGGTFSRNYSVNWQWRKYFGKSTLATLTEPQVIGLPFNSLAPNFSGTSNIPSGPGYVYFAFPVSWGTASSFKDTATNLDVAMEPFYVVSITNGFGVVESYNVHRSTNQLNGAINIAVS